jgi:membrane fusion protein, multidrug efflux system
MIQKFKRNRRIYIPLAVTALLVISASIYWYIDYSSYIQTDDAYVASDNISVSSKITGRISKVYVEEGDTVHQGQLLVELDSTDLLAQKQQTLASRWQTETAKLQAEAKLHYDQVNIKVLQISQQKAEEDFNRTKMQYSGGVVTKEQFDHAKKSLETAQAQLDAAQAQLAVSKAQIANSAALVEGAQAQIGVINTQLNNTRLYAPTNGVVAKRWLLPGDMTQTGQSVYTITNDQKFWVAVYLEETEIGDLRIGQKAKFTLDTYPGLTFTGKIFMIGATTASQFSLIPPSNASGNFTKVTQRVPLKISIEETEDGPSLNAFHFRTGMSAVVKIYRK